VSVLGPLPIEEKRPLVGESLVEPGILFFREMGLGPYLDRTQVLKNGLVFYHKFDLASPGDRNYSVHAPEILFHKARQLRRIEFDIACRERAAALGTRLLRGLARDIRIGGSGAPHRVAATVDDKPLDISCRWIVDATGRKRLIGKQVTSYARPAKQRSTFWFRLRNFEPFFAHLGVHHRRPWQYDPWLSTHHFMGRGYWIWCIPLETGAANLCSIGFTYRPDLFGHQIRSMTDFLAAVDQEHPAIADMVRSGEVVDTQSYLNYFYRSEQLYSDDGWFLVGDAARSVDPLYSNGISMTTVQVGQVATLVERQRGGRSQPGDVDALDQIGRWVMERAQHEVTEQYDIMHDPFQACMRRYFNVGGWFNGFLPLWWSGFFTTPEAARLLLRLFRDSNADMQSLWLLAAEASAAIGPAYTQGGFNLGPDLDIVLNPRFDCRREDAMAALARMFAMRRYMRRRLLVMNSNRKLLREVPRLAGDSLRAVLVRLLPVLRMGAFAALTPPLPAQYARWTGPDRDVPEPEPPYIGDRAQPTVPELTA
jgi:flavin-dependent dehydrogenase